MPIGALGAARDADIARVGRARRRHGRAIRGQRLASPCSLSSSRAIRRHRRRDGPGGGAAAIASARCRRASPHSCAASAASAIADMAVLAVRIVSGEALHRRQPCRAAPRCRASRHRAAPVRDAGRCARRARSPCRRRANGRARSAASASRQRRRGAVGRQRCGLRRQRGGLAEFAVALGGRGSVRRGSRLRCRRARSCGHDLPARGIGQRVARLLPAAGAQLQGQNALDRPGRDTGAAGGRVRRNRAPPPRRRRVRPRRTVRAGRAARSPGCSSIAVCSCRAAASSPSSCAACADRAKVSGALSSRAAARRAARWASWRVAGGDRGKPARQRGVAGAAASVAAAPGEVAGQAQRAAQERADNSEDGDGQHHRRRKHADRGLDLPALPDDVDLARVIGEIRRRRDEHGDQDERDRDAHQPGDDADAAGGLPSRAASSVVRRCSASST